MKNKTLAALNIQEPGANRPHGVPVLRLGFRPFYLVAAALAVVNVGTWTLVYLGLFEWTLPLPALWWHAHEMLMGFAAAVIAGFLLTAGKAWTRRPTPRGAPLGALVVLWVAARLCAVLAPPALFMAVDLAFLPLVALVLLRILLLSGNRRNLPIVGILVLLSCANLGFHLAALGWLNISPLQPLHAALALIVMLETVMGGRVIPGFTMSAHPGLQLYPLPWLENATLALTACGLASWVLGISTPWSAALLLAAALAHAWRAWRWHPTLALGRPLLWILHGAYVWIPMSLLLLGLAAMGWVAPSLGLHALGVGATGGLILGMMARTSRGHTGRELHSQRIEVLAFALVLLAAIARVVLPLLHAGAYAASVGLAALLWCLAYALYLLLYAPWLVRGRVDGLDG